MHKFVHICIENLFFFFSFSRVCKYKCVDMRGNEQVDNYEAHIGRKVFMQEWGKIVEIHSEIIISLWSMNTHARTMELCL